jgi:negative regulator of sigma E activity
MSKTISELLNGQLDASQTKDALNELASNAQSRDSFTLYGLIGDVLRGNSTPDDGYSRRIFERITREGVKPEDGFDPLKDEM